MAIQSLQIAACHVDILDLLDFCILPDLSWFLWAFFYHLKSIWIVILKWWNIDKFDRSPI
jgi:hypothetical protein